MSYLLTILAAAIMALLLWVHIVSRGEQERTAAQRSLIAALVVPIVFVLVAWAPVPAAGFLGWLLVLMVGLSLAIFLIPTVPAAQFRDDNPAGRIDERTTMFARAALKPGSDRFDAYYEEFPEHRESDDACRALPGLMDTKSGKYEALSFAAAEASFTTVAELKALCEGEPATERHDSNPAEATGFIKGWAQKLGTLDCGVTELRDHHLYSVKGRGDEYGRKVTLSHKYAIAFTVEMDHRNLGAAPEGPTVMESAQQYLTAGAVAVQLAVFIRSLGWPAEAHIDGNYKVVCPLVAKDAGLGEIGRMGLLMTPSQGPRVRLGVVTTDMPLELDARTFDPSVLHFCSICRKCADICPVDAVESGERGTIEGAERWRVDSEACFSYWCATGTDCGQCMRVCPYSHPSNTLHNAVRWGLRRSALFRHAALRLDDLLYGRRPKPLPMADWLPVRKRS